MFKSHDLLHWKLISDWDFWPKQDAWPAGFDHSGKSQWPGQRIDTCCPLEASRALAERGEACEARRAGLLVREVGDAVGSVVGVSSIVRYAWRLVEVVRGAGLAAVRCQRICSFPQAPASGRSTDAARVRRSRRQLASTCWSACGSECMRIPIC